MVDLFWLSDEAWAAIDRIFHMASPASYVSMIAV